MTKSLQSLNQTINKKWHVGIKHNQYHLVIWAKVCDPLPSGGLAIRSLRCFNKHYLGSGCGGLGLRGMCCGGG